MHGNSQSDDHDVDLTFNVILIVLRAWAVTVEVFTRRQIGCEYVGFQGFVGIFIILFYAVFYEHGQASEMLYFVPIFLAACFCHRFVVLRRRWYRVPETNHSLYTGRSVFQSLLPRWPEAAVKKLVEPLAVVLIGFLVSLLNAPVGIYFVIGGVAIALTASFDDLVATRQARAMKDSLIEQQQLAERFRNV